MKKEKIAISLDKPLLDIIDGKVDGSIMRSRSQAIEFFLRKGLKEQSIDTLVLLIKGSQQKVLLKNLKGKSLLKTQIDFLYKNGIKNIIIVTQHTKEINLLLNEIENSMINIEIVEKDVKGNADALFAIKDMLKTDFIAMSGDTYNDFNLQKMIKKHLNQDKLATMGLMTRDNPEKYGSAVLDGDSIVEFQEKIKKPKSHIVNAGVYIFKQEVFELFSDIHSLEKELFPKLAKINQLVGFLTYGEYVHIYSKC